MATNRILGPISKPDIKDVLDRTKSDVFYGLNCVQVGKIISFNAEKNTASIQIAMKRQLATGEIVDYPPLQDCPVMVLTGGTSFLSLPIAPGDPCLVLFNDRDIDTWYATGEVNVPPTPRAHSLADGFAIVGVRNQSNALDLDAALVILNGGTQKIAIKNDYKSLKLLVDSLIDAVKNLQIVVSGGSGTVNPTSQAALQAIKAEFDLLLAGGL